MESNAGRVSALRLSVLIGELLGERPSVPYTLQEFSRRIDRLVERFQSQDPLQTFYMQYSLRMTEVTYQRLHRPAAGPDERTLQDFLGRLKPHPEASQEFSQGAVDPASSLRRAESVHEYLGAQGRVLLLGDDDATGLALSLLGDYQIQALDIDERVVDWLVEMGVNAEVRDLRQLPPGYRQAFDAVITDPSRDLELASEFLKAAYGCLTPDGLLFWADHPDWNQAAQLLIERAQGQGLKLLEVRPNWHSYTPHVISDSTARHFRIPARWFYELVEVARIWSHLHVFRKDQGQQGCSQKGQLC